MTTLKFSSHVGEVTRKIHGAAARGLYIAAEHGLEESNRVVPIEEGTLQRSGATSVDAVQLAAQISYDTPYAVRQHQDVTLRHDSGRKAKFLEDTMKGRADAMYALVAREIAKVAK